MPPPEAGIGSDDAMPDSMCTASSDVLCAARLSDGTAGGNSCRCADGRGG